MIARKAQERDPMTNKYAWKKLFTNKNDKLSNIMRSI